jgi:hypothetical protein
MQAIAFMVVTDENMIQVRDALKPHRGEVYAGLKKINSVLQIRIFFLMDF